MEVKIEQTGVVQSSEENVEKSYSYVLHGAQAFCACGSRMARLTIPKCHGTYMHDMPVMTIEDTEAQVNVKAFGFCSALDNPDRLVEVQKVMDKVEEDKNLLDGIMDIKLGFKNAVKNVAKKVASVFGYEEPEDPYHGYSKDVYENVTVLCKPEFAVNDVWKGSSDRLRINGVNALNTNCELVCLKSKDGLIKLADDGQENATSEQHGAADMASWKKGDPIPEANQGNLERLKENIAELEEQLKTANTGEYHRLKAEIDSKIELRDQMSSTLNMVNEIKTGLMLGAYGEDYQSAIKDMNTIQEAFQNGTPCVPVSAQEQNELLNGAYQTHADGGDVAAYLDENASSIPYTNFNGTAVTEENANDVGYIYSGGRLMTRAEYNQSISAYVEELANAENG